MPPMLWVLLLLASAHQASHQASAEHPRMLSQVAEHVWAGALSYRAVQTQTRRMSYVGQQTVAVAVGEYTMTVKLGNVLVEGIVDTGSGIPQVACEGVQSLPGYAISTYNVSATKPLAKLVKFKASPACQMFCNASDGCLPLPTTKLGMEGACEYKVAYSDNSYAIGRVYSAALTFPNSTLPVDAAFYFGCVYKASTRPYFFSNTAALFGMDWDPPSLWSQLITAGLVNDTMYLCLGNGGDGTGDDQSGVIILGSDDSVSVPSEYTSQVITASLIDPSLAPALTYVNTMWLRLTDLSIGATPGVGGYPGSASLIASKGTALSQLYYLLDTGTSGIYLTPKEYLKFIVAFTGALYAVSAVTSDYYTDDEQGAITLCKYYTPAELDTMLPPILFTFTGSSAPLSLLPSNYMVYTAGNNYTVAIANSGDPTMGTLGNAWMAGWLIQQTRSTLALKMTHVTSCNDIIY